MRADRTAVFSDLDGTLFSPEGTVSEENREAIRRYISEGGAFALSTGRAPVNVRWLLGELPTSAPSIVLNGAGVYDFAEDRAVFLRTLDRAKLLPLLRWALAELPGLDLQLYTAAEIFYCTPEATVQREFMEMHRPCSFVPLGTLSDRELVKALLLTEDAPLARLKERLEAEGTAWMDWKLGAVRLQGRGEAHYYELMPQGATKGAALRQLREVPSLRGRTLIGVGDYWNDYELLREADVAVSPANAPAEIQALCDYVTVSNDAHVIKHVIEDIVPRL